MNNWGLVISKRSVDSPGYATLADLSIAAQQRGERI